ncbi:uncharacterized protein LOC112681623 [Sipha flava]|uniref:Uncharacterized protein LOC112681623 n=1 Tax=Sipha flava TaxID=143950 RepID=A0A8B8F9X9_9HEMI|nr:uncharacterized protein LOC112681623 [Sipha flava]
MSTFYDALHFSVLKWVPQVNYTKSNFPSWFSKDLIDLVFLKRRAHAIFKSSRNPLDYREFSLLRSKYKLMSKNCHKKFIERTESQLCSNPKVFWKFIKKNKSCNDISKTVYFNDITSSNEKEVSDLFAKQFSSVYTEHSINHYSTISHLFYDLPSNCFFDLSFIESGLSKLSGDKTIGPDGLSGEFLYMLKSVLSYPLSLLFRKSLDEGIYPDILKLSTVKPIYKSGDKSNVANYRPISLLGHIAKLFDSLVLKSIGPAVSSILIDEQHGFRSGRSTNTCNIVFF